MASNQGTELVDLSTAGNAHDTANGRGDVVVELPTNSWPQANSRRSLDDEDDDFGDVVSGPSKHDEQPLLSEPEKALAPGDPKSPRRKVPLGRLIKLAKPEKWLIIGGTLALIGSSASFLVLPAYAGEIIDAVSKTGDHDAARAALRSAITFLVLFFSLGAVFTGLRVALFTTAGQRVVARLRKHLFGAILRNEIGFFDVNRTGELINRLSSDCSVLQESVTVNVSMGLRWAGQVVGGVIILFVVSWKLTLVMLSTTPVVVIAAVAFGKYVRKLSKDFQELLAKASEVAEETISNVRTVRSFSAETREHGRYSSAVDSSYRLGKKRAILEAVFAGGAMFAANVAIALVLWYGGTLVVDGSMSAGTLTSFILYTLTVAVALGGLSTLYGDLMKAAGASERVFDLLDRTPLVPTGFDGGAPVSELGLSGVDIPLSRDLTRLSEMRGQIRLEGVRFSYPSRPETFVLDGVDLTLRPGAVTALVGPSGGGKTTITHLLELFYHPAEGRIFVDNVDITTLDPSWLHKHVAIVSQEPTLFATTIAENIAYGNPSILESSDRGRSAIEQAARLANAHEFISKFSEGYEAVVGERGVRLSGGQKQRIAIARALLVDPTVLLLDEATSALDAESEHLVQQALDRLMNGRTVLVIAHRLSTVANAAEVAVVDHGKIVERGTHRELLEHGGIYKKLVNRQLQK